MLENLLNITFLALVDAINPCTISVQVLLLTSLLFSKGRKEALLGGILFTLTIYVSYFLYGLGALQLLYLVLNDKIIRFILYSLLLLMSFAEIYAFFRYKPGFVSMEMPMKLRPIAKKSLNYVEKPLMAIPVALLCSLLLLPCSSGPYVSALIIMRNDVDKIVKLLYYNFVFVLPMLLITFGIYFGFSPQKINKWKEEKIRYLHLISGILLLVVLLLI